ncbi:hypothetical protein [Arcobacter sp. CECT 8985]|uniref:hypothetical protein n=1 Tax=Arcobacter sp. CECT 8985 TaxID=1935424 RepID=UPI00100B2292|nr:hypothetical protein [Arcobacter sp. CECT 8985]RXJ86852.1 hypothetical protein CRU93_06520 [Arcobacter sp. CECT 8985]
MFNMIIYKEYLKTIKIISIFLILIACCLFNTYFSIQDSLVQYSSTNAILMITQMGVFDYSNLEYVCMLFAIFLATAQFYPEVTNGRIRLFLHLPMSQNLLISALVSVGGIFLVLIFSIITVIYFFMITSSFPTEVFYAVFSRVLPSFIASLLCYFTTMIVFLEPKGIRKITYILVSYLIIDKYIALSKLGYFVSTNLNVFVITVLIVYIIIVFDVFTSYTKGYIK